MAHPSGRQPTTSIFIGNVGFSAVEDELAAIFKQAGPLKSFRLVTDRETGKSKGYAFAEYFDLATSASAQRNLNGTEYGGRALRVDFADNEKHGSEHHHHKPHEPRRPLTVGREATQAAEQTMAAALGGPGGAGQQQISEALAKMTRGQLFEIMSQMRGLIQQNPTQARQILVQNPQLTKALFQAQILLGMVSPPPAANGVAPAQPAQQPLQATMLPGQQAPLAPGQQPAPGQVLPGGQPGMAFPQPGFPGQPQPGLAPQQLPGAVPLGVPGAMQPQAGLQPGPVMSAAPADPRQRPVDPRQQAAAPVDPRLQAPQQAPLDPRQMRQPVASQPLDPRQQQQPGGAAMPGFQPPMQVAPLDPRQQQPMQPVPVDPRQQMQPAPVPALQQIPAEQQALLRQVMSLTPQQIEMLPEAQKQQVLDVQRQLRAAGLQT